MATNKKNPWSMKEVDKVVPRRYPTGQPIPPETRREIYAYCLLEKKLRSLKKVGKLSGNGKKSLRRVV